MHRVTWTQVREPVQVVLGKPATSLVELSHTDLLEDSALAMAMAVQPRGVGCMLCTWDGAESRLGWWAGDGRSDKRDSICY